MTFAMPSIEQDPKTMEIAAEQLLMTYYPEVGDWKADHCSFFSRNYTGDLKSVNVNTRTVSLSRNGMYDILPEKMFFDVDELRFMEPRDFALKLSEIYEKEKNVRDCFMPFDSFFFNMSLRLHTVVGRMIDDRVPLLLGLLFGYDIEAEPNEYVRLLAPLLLNATEIRADFELLAQVLSTILECTVDFKLIRQDGVFFIVNKRNLSSKEYLAFMKQLKPLFDFVGYWFVPMQMDCFYKVKDYHQPFVLSTEKALVLDYNTQI